MGAFGTSNKADRKRRRKAVDFRQEVKKNGERVYNRKWMIYLAIVVVGLLLWFHVI